MPLLKFFILSFVVLFAPVGFAVELGVHDSIQGYLSRTEGQKNYNMGLVTISNGTQKHIVLDANASSDDLTAKYRAVLGYTDVIQAYISAGNKVTLQEPVKFDNLQTVALNLQKNVETNSKFAKAYTDKLLERLDLAESRARTIQERCGGAGKQIRLQTDH